jgi:hypothetical protein
MVTTRPLPSALIALSAANRFDFSKIKFDEAIRQPGTSSDASLAAPLLGCTA